MKALLASCKPRGASTCCASLFQESHRGPRPIKWSVGAGSRCQPGWQAETKLAQALSGIRLQKCLIGQHYLLRGTKVLVPSSPPLAASH